MAANGQAAAVGLEISDPSHTSLGNTPRASTQGGSQPMMLCEGESHTSHTRLIYPWRPEVHGSGPASELKKLAGKATKKTREALCAWGPLEWLTFFLPCVGWLRTYKWKRWLPNDIVAGISVGFMAIPQGIAYASLAGLPSAYGLYGVFLPCLVYCLFGSCRQLGVGPVAVTSLLLAANLQAVLPCSQQISNPNSPPSDLVACQAQYNTAAVQVCFIVSLMLLGMGVLRIGWVTKFLSHAVIGGFTTGAAITIGIGQVKYLVGYSITMGSSTRLQDYLQQYFSNIRQLRWQEFVMGVTFIFILVGFKEMHRLWKPLRHLRSLGALFVCLTGVASVYIGLVDTPDRGSIKIVGSIPQGLPGWSGDWWIPMDDPTFSQLVVPSIIILVVALLESTSIARALARKNGYELSYNREIIGLGLANVAGAMSMCYTTTGSFSRSAVNNNAGAKTPLAQFVCGWVVGFVLIFLTPVFSKVPFNAMAAIIIVSVAGLVEYEQAIYLWRVNKLDLVVFLASCFGTLFYSIEVGLAIAIGLAIFITVHQSAFPHTAVLGKVPGSSYVYRNIKQYPDSQVYPGILAFRIDAPLYFANVNSLEDKIEKAIVKASAWSQVQGLPQLLFLILDLTPVHHLDSMGLRFLEDLVFETRGKGIQLMLANPNKNVVRDWERVKLPELLGRDWVFVSVHEATIFALRRLCELGYSIIPVGIPTSSSGSTSALMSLASKARNNNGTTSGSAMNGVNGGGKRDQSVALATIASGSSESNGNGTSVAEGTKSAAAGAATGPTARASARSNGGDGSGRGGDRSSRDFDLGYK